jgi:ABC-2 type transport system ATP-binding protein
MASTQTSAEIVGTKPGGDDRVIDLKNVQKVYKGKVHALRGVSMHVQRGEIFGLLGPNGAGKSTLVKILMTVIRASSAQGSMLSMPIGDKGTLARVGYLPEHHRFPEYLTGRQVLDYFAALSGVPRVVRRKRADELLELVGLKEWQNHRVKQYSKGMRQRVGIAQALMNDPDLVLLDEPTDGVDPVGRRDIRNILLEEKRRGRTVLLNSHLLSELEMVCDRVAIMVKGEVSMQGTIDELTRESKRYEIDVDLGATPTEVRERAAQLAPALPGMVETAAPMIAPSAGAPALGRYQGKTESGLELKLEGATLTAYTDDAMPVQGLIDLLRARGVVIRAVRPVRASLEDLFMKAVTDPSTGKAMAPGAIRPGQGKNGGAA